MRRTTDGRIAWLAGCALLAFAPGTARAQEQQGAGAAADGGIIVTAQRRSEALQNVPVAITVFTSELRDKLGVKTIQDFTNFTPGLSYDTGNDRLSLRGIGRLTNLIGSDPGVATYNDGFYTSSAVEASKTPMFVKRVEVLRGPQGTLYGRNSVGGALNVISNRPTDQFQGEYRSTVEQNYGGAVIEGYVAGPIAGALKGRFTAQIGPLHLNDTFHNIGIDQQGRGFGANGEGYRQRTFFEAQLQYDVSPTTQFWLKWTSARWDDHTRQANLVTPYETATIFPAGALVPNAAFGYATANPGANNPRLINANTYGTQTLRNNHTIVGAITTQVGDVAIKYVGGYQQYLYTGYSDLDDTAVSLVKTGAGTLAQFSPLGAAFAYSYNPTYVQEYIEDKKYYSNELTFSSASKGKLNWIMGLYQYHEKFYQPITWYVDGAATDSMSLALLHPVNIVAGGLADPNPRRTFYAGTGLLRLNSLAAFGQADAEIAPGLKLTGGLRYSSDRKTGSETYRLVNWNPTAPLPGCFGLGCGAFTPAFDITSYVTGAGNGAGAVARTLTGKWDGLTGRLALDYKPDARTLLFASYGRGLKSGGFTLGIWAAQPTVAKEDVDAFEAGIKSAPMAGTTLNLTGFHYVYHNAQVPIDVRQPLSGLVRPQFFNIPRATSTGFELETMFNPVRWLELSANYSYLDAKVTSVAGMPALQDSSVPGSPTVSLLGNRMPQSSRHKLAASALIEMPTATSGTWMLAGSYVYRSAAYYSVLNSPHSLAPGWDQVDLRLTWVSPGKRFTAIGYVRNVFNTLGYDGAAGGSGGGSQGYGQTYSFTPPRSFGAEIQFRF